MRHELCCLMLLPALAAGPVLAQTADRPATGGDARPQQPIQIEADRAEITQQSGTSIYSGRVNLKQGDLEMQGERLEIQRDSQSGELKAVLTGKPAQLRQPVEGGEVVNARADRINYQSNDKSLDLQGNALYERGRDRVSGQSIRYDANAKKLLASGPNQGGGRVQIIIQPQNQGQP